jgi:hypothetical protein
MRQIKLMALMALIPGIFSIVPAFMTARAIQRDRADIRGSVTRINRLEDLYYKDILGSISIEGIKEADLTTGQKFDNLPPDSNIEALKVGH